MSTSTQSQTIYNHTFHNIITVTTINIIDYVENVKIDTYKQNILNNVITLLDSYTMYKQLPKPKIVTKTIFESNLMHIIAPYVAHSSNELILWYKSLSKQTYNNFNNNNNFKNINYNINKRYASGLNKSTDKIYKQMYNKIIDLKLEVNKNYNIDKFKEYNRLIEELIKYIININPITIFKQDNITLNLYIVSWLYNIHYGDWNNSSSIEFIDSKYDYKIDYHNNIIYKLDKIFNIYKQYYNVNINTFMKFINKYMKNNINYYTNTNSKKDYKYITK